MVSVDKLVAVDKMQAYINDHLDEVITLKQLAKACNYSIYHSARIFKELVGYSPFEYIRRMRLSKAALVLRDQHKKVIDVAFDFVFDSHEGFTKAFSKLFGISPIKYAQQAPPIQLFTPTSPYKYYLTLNKGEKIMSETKTVFVQVVERPKRKAIIKRGIKATNYFEYCEDVGCDVWGLLTSVKEAIYEPVGMWLPKHLIKEGTSLYVQGVEVPFNFDKPVPEDYEIIDLPACKMMIFQGEPFNDDDYCEAIDEMWILIDKYNPHLYGYDWDDDAGPRIQLEPAGYRGYIEGRPVKELNK